MKKIPLTRGLFALVDDEDFDVVSKYKWCAAEAAGGHLYAMGGGKLMHRFILGAIKGQVIDHKNGDGLDNRRTNIRICSQSQNGANRKTNKNNTSGVKGVYFQSDGRKLPWRASVWYKGKPVVAGHFSTKAEAAVARKLAADILFGEFAKP